MWYTDKNGVSQTGRGPSANGTSTGTEAPQVGDTVSVYYSTTDPAQIVILNIPGGGLAGIAGGLRTTGIVCLAVGAILLLAGIIGLVAGRKKAVAAAPAYPAAPLPPGQGYPGPAGSAGGVPAAAACGLPAAAAGGVSAATAGRVSATAQRSAPALATRPFRHWFSADQQHDHRPEHQEEQQARGGHHRQHDQTEHQCRHLSIRAAQVDASLADLDP